MRTDTRLSRTVIEVAIDPIRTVLQKRIVDGGDLFVELGKNDEVKMTGPAEYSFTGLTG